VELASPRPVALRGKRGLSARMGVTLPIALARKGRLNPRTGFASIAAKRERAGLIFRERLYRHPGA